MNLNRHVSKEDSQLANKQMLVIRETQIKPQLRYHYTPIRIAKVKKRQAKTSFSKDVKKLESSYIAGEIIKWCSHFEKQFGSCLKC